MVRRESDIRTQSENPPLGRSHAQPEKHVWHCPGCRYGWPKNLLHWAGIHESILDICATVRPEFVIADGILAMGGDGPLNGTVKHLHTILLADDPVAADANLADLLGVSPSRVRHIHEANRFIGNFGADILS